MKKKIVAGVLVAMTMLSLAGCEMSTRKTDGSADAQMDEKNIAEVSTKADEETGKKVSKKVTLVFGDTEENLKSEKIESEGDEAKNANEKVDVKVRVTADRPAPKTPNQPSWVSEKKDLSEDEREEEDRRRNATEIPAEELAEETTIDELAADETVTDESVAGKTAADDTRDKEKAVAEPKASPEKSKIVVRPKRGHTYTVYGRFWSVTKLTDSDCGVAAVQFLRKGGEKFQDNDSWRTCYIPAKLLKKLKKAEGGIRMADKGLLYEIVLSNDVDSGGLVELPEILVKYKEITVDEIPDWGGA